LPLIRKLESCMVEKLYTIIAEGVVGGGDNHPRVGSHGRGDEGDGGRGKGTQKNGVGTRGTDAAGERVLQHGTGATGVLSDHHAAVVGGALTTKELGNGPA